MAASELEKVGQLADFLELLRDVNILSDPQFQRAILALPDQLQTAREVADILIQQKFLTPYQASRLLQNKADGYVLGPYLLLDLLRSRSSERIYRARHRTMNRIVAIKILASHVTNNEQLLNHFYAQAQRAAKLVHPNVVTVLDVNQIGKRLYIVLDYVEGAGANQVVQRSGPLPPPQAYECIRQASLGLQHAHEHELHHGSLWPNSLLIGRTTGEQVSAPVPQRMIVKLTNFGLWTPARLHDEQESDQDLADYRAPEASTASKFSSAAADVYSLGCVLVFLLTGRPPFPRATLAEKLTAHRDCEPPAIRVSGGPIPAAIQRLIEQMLAKDPRQRPTAEEVANRLRPYADSDDPTARIDFDFVGTQQVSASMGPGFLAGMQPSSTQTPLPPARTLALDDTFPWSELNDQTVEAPLTVDTVHLKPGRQQPSRPWLSGPTLIGVMALTICLATFLGISFAFRRFAP